MASNREISTSAPSSFSASADARPVRSRKSCGDAGKTAQKPPKRRKALKNLFWGSTGGGGSHSGKSRKELLKEVFFLKRENAKLQQECTYTKLIYSELKQDRLVEMERTSKARARKKRILAARLAAVQDAGLFPKLHERGETRYSLQDGQNTEEQMAPRASGDQPVATDEGSSSSSSLAETSTPGESPDKPSQEPATLPKNGGRAPRRDRVCSEVQMPLQQVIPVPSRHGRKAIMVRPERRAEYVSSSQFDTDGIIIHEPPTLYSRRGSAARTASTGRSIDNIGGIPVIYAERADDVAAVKDSRDISKDTLPSEKDRENVLTLAERMAEYGMPDMEAMGIYASTEAVLQGSLHSPPDSPLDVSMPDVPSCTPSSTITEDPVVAETARLSTAGGLAEVQEEDDLKRKRSVSFSDARDSKTPEDSDREESSPEGKRDTSVRERQVTEEVEVTAVVYESSESSLQKIRYRDPSSKNTLIERLREAASRASTVDQRKSVRDTGGVFMSPKAEDGHGSSQGSKVLTPPQGREKELVAPLNTSTKNFFNRRAFPSKTTDDLTTRRSGSGSTAFSRRRASDSASVLPQRASSDGTKGRGAKLATTETLEAKERGEIVERLSRRSRETYTNVHEMSICKKKGKDGTVSTKNQQTVPPSRAERPAAENAASPPQGTQSLELMFTVTAYPDGAAPERSSDGVQSEPTVQEPSTSRTEHETSTRRVVPEQQQQIETRKGKKKKKSSGKRQKSQRGLEGEPGASRRSRKSKSSKSTDSRTSKGLLHKDATSGSKESEGSVRRHPLDDDLLTENTTTVTHCDVAPAVGIASTSRGQQVDKNANAFPRPSTSDANGNIDQEIRTSPPAVLSAQPPLEDALSTLAPGISGTLKEKGSPYVQSAAGSSRAPTCPPPSGRATQIKVSQRTEIKSRHFIHNGQETYSDVSTDKIRESSSSSQQLRIDAEQKAPVTTPAKSRQYIAEAQTSESLGLRTPNKEALLPRGQEVEEQPQGVQVQPGPPGRRGLLPSFVNLVDAAKVDNITASTLDVKSPAAIAKPSELPPPSQGLETPSTSRFRAPSPAFRHKEYQRQRPTAPQVDSRPVSWEEVQSCLLPAFYKFSDNALSARSSKSVYDLGETI